MLCTYILAPIIAAISGATIVLCHDPPIWRMPWASTLAPRNPVPPPQQLEQPHKDVIPLLRAFQWLLITLKIKSKLFSMVSKALLAIFDLVFIVFRAYGVSSTCGPFPVPGTFPAHFSIEVLVLAVPSLWEALLPAWLALGHLWSPPHKSISGLKS